MKILIGARPILHSTVTASTTAPGWTIDPAALDYPAAMLVLVRPGHLDLTSQSQGQRGSREGRGAGQGRAGQGRLTPVVACMMC